MSAGQTFATLLTETAARHSTRIALELPGARYTYHELHNRAVAIARAIDRFDGSDSLTVAILSAKTVTAYAAVLGAVLAGRAYLPLSLRSPATRIARMLTIAGTRCLVIGKSCVHLLPALLNSLATPLTVLTEEGVPASELTARFPGHRFVELQTEMAADVCAAAPDRRGRLAYVLFTSGSTGVPKGVPVDFENVLAYLANISRILDISPSDRCSQTFDLTFDLSAHDMFVCWTHGACLCVPVEGALLAPAKYVRNYALTCWFSVPSLISLPDKLGLLKAGSMPTLRSSLFCGEVLSSSNAKRWQRAAVNSRLYNLYGPTECTIAVTSFELDRDAIEQTTKSEYVPIGRPFPAHDVRVLDQNLQPVALNTPGELCISGSQVTRGYLGTPEQTMQHYVQLPHCGPALWYRTGDLVRQDSARVLYFLGRVDNQVKLRGFRVELEEIDIALREAAGTDLALAVAWPVGETTVDAIYGVVQSCQLSEAQMLGRCRTLLADYMLPERIFVMDEIPRNTNGKLDRTAAGRQVLALL